MSHTANYIAWRERRGLEDGARAKLQTAAATGDPTNTAQAQEIASQVAAATGNRPAPAGLVEDNRELFDKIVVDAKLDAIRASAPKLAEWLDQRQNFALVKGDLDNLLPIATTIARIGEPPKAPPLWQMWPKDRQSLASAPTQATFGNPGANTVGPLKSTADKMASAAGQVTKGAGDAAFVPILPTQEMSNAGATGAPEAKKNPNDNATGIPGATTAQPASVAVLPIQATGQAFVSAAPGAQADLSVNAAEAPRTTIDNSGYWTSYGSVPSAQAEEKGWASNWELVFPTPEEKADREKHIDRIVNAANASDEDMADLRLWIQQQKYFNVERLDDVLSRTHAGKTPPNEARAELEPLFAPITNAIARGLWGFALAYNYSEYEYYARLAKDRGRSFDEILADTKILEGLVASPVDLYDATSRWLLAKISSGTRDENVSRSVYYAQRAGKLYERINSLPWSVTATRYANLRNGPGKDQSTTGQVSKYFGDILEEPVGFTSLLLEAILEGMPIDAAAMAAAGVTKSPGVGIAVATTGSFIQNRFTASSDYLAKQGLDIRTLEGARRAATDQKLFDEAKTYGETRALFIALMDGLSAHMAGKQLVESPIGNALVQISAPAAMAMAGEAAAQTASGQDPDLNAILLKGLGALVKSAAQQAGEAGFKAIGEGLAKAQVAMRNQAMLRQLSEQASVSKIRRQQPEVFRGLVDNVTQGTPAEYVYIPIERFVDTLKSNGADPWQIARGLKGMTRAEYDAALLSGGDLRIRTSAFVTDLSSTKEGTALMPDMKFNPLGMTTEKANEFVAQAMGKIQEIADEAVRQGFTAPDEPSRRANEAAPAGREQAGAPAASSTKTATDPTPATGSQGLNALSSEKATASPPDKADSVASNSVKRPAVDGGKETVSLPPSAAKDTLMDSASPSALVPSKIAVTPVFTPSEKIDVPLRDGHQYGPSIPRSKKAHIPRPE